MSIKDEQGLSSTESGSVDSGSDEAGGSTEPGTAESGTAESGTTESATTQPDVTQSGTTKSAGQSAAISARSLKKLVQVINKLAAGDLSVRADAGSKGAGAVIGKAVNEAIDALHERTSKIQQAATEVIEASEATALSITATNSPLVNDGAHEDSVRRSIDTSAKRLKRLGENVQRTADIVAVVGELGARTNRLAVNTAIVATGPKKTSDGQTSDGQANHEMTVLADEMSALAIRNEQFAEQLAGLIAQIQSDAQEATRAMEETTSAIVTLMASAHDATADVGSLQQDPQLVVDGDNPALAASGACSTSRPGEAVARLLELSALLKNTVSQPQSEEQATTQPATSGGAKKKDAPRLLSWQAKLEVWRGAGNE